MTKKKLIFLSNSDEQVHFQGKQLCHFYLCLHLQCKSTFKGKNLLLSISEKPVYDKAATKKFDDMLDGDLRDLPPLPKSMVRVFLSSTFSGICSFCKTRNTVFISY